VIFITEEEIPLAAEIGTNQLLSIHSRSPATLFKKGSINDESLFSG
jgi:hypothetical protein